MGKTIRFYLNDKLIETERPQGMVLADLIRNDERLTGTRIGCREGECGACTVLIGRFRCGVFSYRAVASCLTPLGQANGCHIITIEGINPADGSLNPLQQAFVDYGATQCGFCTPGFILSLTGFFCGSPGLTLEDAIDAVDGNICRCTGYESIRQAIRYLVEEVAPRIDPDKPRVVELVRMGILPKISLSIEDTLAPLVATGGGQPEPDDILVAGATDLLVQKADAMLDAHLYFLEAPVCGIREDGSRIHIAGTVNVSRLEQDDVIHQHLPHLREWTNRISSTIMRNRATIAGNIVNASPIGDLSIMFLARGARLHLRKGETVRERELADFFIGYKDFDLGKGEVVEMISIPIPDKSNRFVFDKVAMRRYLDIAACNAALSLEYDGKVIRNVRIAAGGVAPIPLLLKEAPLVLEGQPLSTSLVKEAVAAALREVKPIDDIRGSARYKKTLLRQIIFGLFLKLFPVELQFNELLGKEAEQ